MSQTYHNFNIDFNIDISLKCLLCFEVKPKVTFLLAIHSTLSSTLHPINREVVYFSLKPHLLCRSDCVD